MRYRLGQISDPSVVSVLLAEIPRIVVAAPGLQPGSDEQDVSWLQTLPWLALNTFYRNEVALTNSNNNSLYRLPIEPRLSTDSLYAMRNALLCGMGVGMSHPGWSRKTWLRDGLSICFLNGRRRSYPLIWSILMPGIIPPDYLVSCRSCVPLFRALVGVMPRQIT
ncbi:LysR substrate binding domain [Cedecea neteri]|uniref:LysR substrate binding domain n=1 Tax=Cedecea neteri TaxID=158822 RepID=A0A2X3J8G4_9ENTR|nr:LysR substrate binding domain [Cedecea neteri]